MKTGLIALHSSSRIPTVTSMPASVSIFIPRPLTLAKGSSDPTTTRGIPVSIMSLEQGGVFP